MWLPLAMRIALRAVAFAGAFAAASAHADIPVVELDGVVHAVTAAHVTQAIDRADAAGRTAR